MKYLYAVATHYLDSVNQFFPVADLTFIGQEAGDTMPPLSTDYIDEQKAHYLISFNFDKKGKESIHNRSLRSIDIWNKGEFHTFEYGPHKKRFVDALLSSDSAFDNTKLPLDTFPRKSGPAFQEK